MSLTPDQLADRLVARLVERGLDPFLASGGAIVINEGATAKEKNWAHANPDAMRGALVRAKRYTPGTLDKAYGIEEPK